MQLETTESMLAEIEWLRIALAQAERRAAVAANAYHQQQDAQRDLETLLQAKTERALAAERRAHQLAYAGRRLAAAWRESQQRVAEQDAQIAELAALAYERED